jgi:hypothetical protein
MSQHRQGTGGFAMPQTPAVREPSPPTPLFDFADPHSPLAPLYLRPATAFAALALAFVFVFFTHVPLWHTDVWAHLRFGERIATEGRLFDREGFSGDFADQETPYIHFQWLTQLGMYYLFAAGRGLAGGDEDARLAGGALLLCVGHAAAVTLRLALLLVAFRRLTGSLPVAMAGVVLATAGAFFNHLGIQRPQVLGEVLFAALLVPLSRPVLSRRAVVLIPLVFALWANFHGSFPTGFILLGTVLAGRTLEATRDGGWRPGAAWRDTGIRRLALTLLLSLVGASINPYGPALFAYCLRLSGHPNIPTLEEWKPLPLASPAGYAFLVSAGLLAVLAWLNPARLTPTRILLLLVFGLSTLARARIMVWWCMVFPWTVLPLLQATAARLGRRGVEPARPDLRWSVGTVLGVPLLLAWSAPGLWLMMPHGPDGVAPALKARRLSPETPVQAARLIREECAADHGGALGRTVFASESTGDYLFWALRMEPRVRVSCYTHLHLLRPEHWRECMAVKFGDAGWQYILDEMGARYLVVESRLYGGPDGFSRLIEAVRADPARWRVLAEGPVFVARRVGRAANDP